MRASGEGKKRLIRLLSIVCCFLGGMLLVGRLSKSASRPPSDPSPMSEERREKLKALQRVVQQLRREAKQGNWARVEALAEPEGLRSGLLSALKAEAQARQGHHTDAARTMALLHHNQREFPVLLLSERQGEYQLLVAESLRRTPQEPTAGYALRMAWSASLSREPLPPELARQVLLLAERGLALSVEPEVRGEPPFGLAMGRRNQPDRADALRVMGMVLLRQGRNADALKRLQESEALRPAPQLLPLLALAHRRLGAREKADALEADFQEFLTQSFGAQARPPEYFLLMRELADARKG